MAKFASRAGKKLQFALDKFQFSVKGLVVADFGSSTGGFVDCLLQNGVRKVYSVDTAYGELAWELRKNPKVVVIERTNAMYVDLPKKVDLITIDVGWTKQVKIMPSVINNLKKNGKIISLIKPQYEAEVKDLIKGRLRDKKVDEVINKVRSDLGELGINIIKLIESPILGGKGKNREFLMLASCPA